MLMYKFKVYQPIVVQKDKGGKWKIVFQEYKLTAEEKAAGFKTADTGLDDPFYSAAFTNRRVRTNMKKHFSEIQHNMNMRRQSVFAQKDAKPVNRLQGAALKIRDSNNLRRSNQMADGGAVRDTTKASALEPIAEKTVVLRKE